MDPTYIHSAPQTSIPSSTKVQTLTGLSSPFRAAINASTNGLNEVVAAVTTKKIIVLHYTIVTAGAVNINWESSGGTLMSGIMDFAANGGVSTPWNPSGHMETVAGESLKLRLSAGVSVGGHLTYILE